MGIVVTVFMLVALILLAPTSGSNWAQKLSQPSRWRLFLGRGVLLLGMWNWLWYGLRHLQTFWGQAALISGLLMCLAGVLILWQQGDPWLSARRGWGAWLQRALAYRRLLWGLLLACFALYAITLVRLNLGLSIVS